IYLKKSSFKQNLEFDEDFSTSENRSELIEKKHFQQRHLDQVYNYFQDKSSSKKKILQILAKICLEKENLHQALFYLQKLLNEKLRNRLPNDLSLANLYYLIGKIYFKEASYNKSLIYFNLSLDCLFIHKSFKNSSIQKIFQFIGQIFLKKDFFYQFLINPKQTNSFDFHRTISYFSKLLNKQIQQKFSKEFSYEEIYQILANVYLQEQQFNKALFYYHQLINYKYRKNSNDYFQLGQINEIMAEIYFKQKNLNRAQQFYLNALNFYRRTYPENLHLTKSLQDQIRRLIIPSIY
ncbi:unnamed protein product, partial [Adineta ricciae]